jgi:prepilin-type N-terminal cleavage/methylation domain-containing protein
MRRRLTAALRGGEGGFTLVELVISMTLIGVVFAIYSVTMSSTIRTSTEVQENSVLQGEVRAAVEGIARDLRQAYTGNGSPGLETMTATQIQFLSPDRATPYHLRRINYRLSSGKLERAIATSTNTGSPPWTFPALSTYVTEVGSVVGTTVFSYYNAEGTQTTTAADVAGVKIKVTVANAQAPSRLFTYETSVGLRVPQ